VSATSEVLTLLGVVVGAAATFGVSTLSERARYKRELRMRWDTSKRDAYLQYVVAVTQMARAAGQIAGSRGWDGLAIPAAGEGALDRLDKAEIDRTGKFENVMLLGDPDCIDAAHELNRCAWHMEWLVRGIEACTEDSWKEARENYVVALNKFHQRARASLIISGAPLIERVVERPPTLRPPSGQHDEAGYHN
jgi:hypothetical protein